MGHRQNTPVMENVCQTESCTCSRNSKYAKHCILTYTFSSRSGSNSPASKAKCRRTAAAEKYGAVFVSGLCSDVQNQQDEQQLEKPEQQQQQQQQRRF